MSRRHFLGVMGGAAGGVVLLSACGDDNDDDTAASGNGDGDTTTTSSGDGDTTTSGSVGGIPTTSLTSVTLGYNNPNAVLRAPIFVGQSKGYFEEVGITEITVNDADDYIGPLITGSFDIALADADVLFQFNEQENPEESIGLKMIGINQGAQPLVMIANEGVTADGLAGLKVGGARAGSVNEAISKFILSELGYDWETDVEFINQTGGSNDWVTAMLSGQLDATVAFPRHIGLAEAEGGTALFQDFLSAPQAGFCVTEAIRSEHPDFSAAWNHAWINAQRFCKTQANKDEVIQILADDWEIEVPPNSEAVYDLDSTIFTADNGFDPSAMDEWMTFIKPFNDLPDDINDKWRAYFDLTGLHTAQEALELDINPSADLSSGTDTTANL